MTNQLQLDYALMAGAAYVSNRNLKNRFTTPDGWITTNYEEPIVGGSGFEAIAFIRIGTELKTSPEIGISYTGTNGDGDIPLTWPSPQANSASSSCKLRCTTWISRH